jgi:hypothetical protein
MKVEKKTWILLYSWLPTWTYHKNLVNLDFFIFWNLSNLGHFAMENSLYRLRSYFSGRNLAKFSQTGFHLLMPFNLITLPQELRMWCLHTILGNINIFASIGLELVIIYIYTHTHTYVTVSTTSAVIFFGMGMNTLLFWSFFDKNWEFFYL